MTTTITTTTSSTSSTSTSTSSSPAHRVVAVAAPGKALLAGGYLVLDRNYSGGGWVVATTSRFYTRCSGGSTSLSLIPSVLPSTIHVVSPQFTDGEWLWQLARSRDDDDDDGDGVVVLQRPESASSHLCAIKNPYLEITLLVTLNLARIFIDRNDSGGGRMNTISPTSSSLLEITILADNDFYSQREELSRLSLPLTTASLRSLKPFASTHSSLKNVHKTGLGSSAAMITSLVGCLLSYLGVVYLSRTDDTHYTNTNTTTSKFNHQRYSKDLIHNIAQFCHCLAQGKIGSGFDVSSAVYGSHRYTRFSHSVIEHLLVQGEKILGGGTGIGGGKAEAAQFYKELANVVDPNEKRWDCRVQESSLPRRLILRLADLDAGSSTPKLVSKVLTWRASNPEQADPLWKNLDTKNKLVGDLLDKLCSVASTHPSAYDAAIDSFSQLKASEWEKSIGGGGDVGEDNQVLVTQRCLIQLYSAFQDVRTHLRQMSRLAHVPIEPEEQTRLLDACMDIPGIIMAGVPGAGGYDALFIIGLDVASVDRVEMDVWACWEMKMEEEEVAVDRDDDKGGKLGSRRSHVVSIGPLLAEAEAGSRGLEQVFDQRIIYY